MNSSFERAFKGVDEHLKGVDEHLKGVDEHLKLGCKKNASLLSFFKKS